MANWSNILLFIKTSGIHWDERYWSHLKYLYIASVVFILELYTSLWQYLKVIKAEF